MSESAVRAESVKTGVVNDERFENLAASVHGFGGLRGIHQDSENVAERQRLLESGDADWLIPYLKMEPETAQLQPAELRSLAVIRHMEIRGGAHSRVKEYLQLGNDLQTAIMKGEAAAARSEDSADYAPTETGIERKPKDSYLGSSLSDLMDTNKPVSSNSSSRRKNKRAQLKAIVGTCENCERPIYSGIVVCQECGHVASERRGRKLRGNEPRINVKLRVDPNTRRVFRNNRTEIMSAWMDICGKLVASGCKLSSIDDSVIERIVVQVRPGIDAA